MQRIREHVAQGEWRDARDLLLQTYQLDPGPQLLFALGQAEFNLGNFPAAITYYTRFLASNPDAEQAALAQQAMGAARARLSASETIIIRKYERDWDAWSSVAVALGGAAVITGGSLLGYGLALGRDATDSEQTFVRRMERAEKWQWVGSGVAAGGAVIIAAALVRFGVRRVEVMPVERASSSGAVGLAIGGRW